MEDSIRCQRLRFFGEPSNGSVRGLFACPGGTQQQLLKQPETIRQTLLLTKRCAVRRAITVLLL
ncbi:hypothetical protein FRC20_008526, partial [Serendipita sp. 405]